MHPDRSSLPFPQTLDRPLGEGTFFGRRFPIRTTLHLSTERFVEPAELNWLHLSEGERSHIMIRPYILQQQHSPPQPSADPELDALFGRPGESPAYTALGAGAAWYYPAVQGIFLWEIYLAPPFRTVDPVTDPNLPALWQACEAILLELFPHTQFLVTPAGDPGIDQDSWDRFLFSCQWPAYIARSLAI